MTDHAPVRCGTCDAENPGDAGFCLRCGAAVTAMVSSGSNAASQTYMIGAIAVAAVLIVGGALFLFTGSNARDSDGEARDDVTGVATSELPAADATTTGPPPTTAASATVPVATVPSTTGPPAPSSTAAPVPSPPPSTVAATTAPPTTAPPTTAPPTTAPSTTGPPTPVVTVAPVLTAADAETFFRGYLAAADAGDYVSAWNRLSSNDQADYADGGFDQFVRFWETVSFAEVQRIESVGGSSGFQSFVVDMAYGQVDGDPTSLEIIEVDVNVRPDGTVQIFDYRYVGQQ